MIKNLPNNASFLLLTVLTLFFYGCADKSVVAPTPKVKPEITVSYLFEHRIISHSPSRDTTLLATLPFEIKTFDETYIINLLAQMPTASHKDKRPRYLISIQRQASDWQEYRYVYSQQAADLTLKSPYSGIRHGIFYTNYVVGLTYEQLIKLQNSDLYLTLSNTRKGRTLIELPKIYIQAFVMMIDHHTNERL